MRILLFLLIVPCLVHGQHAIIRGVAPLATGEEIQLRVYDDPISGTERVLASQKIDVDGSFELQVIPNGEAQYAFLQVGTNCADFFIQRDKEIELSFVPPKLDPNQPRGFNERQFFIPKITGGSGKRLNVQIISFNDTLDGFLSSIYPELKTRKSPSFVGKQVEQFSSAISEKFKGSDPFVQEYISYSIAGIEQTFLTDRKRLYEKYLKGVQPSFHNPAFNDFLLQYYQGVVYNLLSVSKKEVAKKALATQEGFAKIDALLLEAEPTLKDASLRRMVLLHGLDEIFGHQEFDKQKLNDAIRRFGMLSSNSYLANAARNIAEKHSTLTPGTLAPEIVFTNVKGAESKLSDNAGKYVFLELTDATNVYSNRETNVIPNLKDDFKFVQFITICVGNTEREMLALQRKMNIDWEIGRISMSSNTLEDYRIKSLPLFFIIDPDGKFYAAPAKDPTKGAQQELMALKEKLRAKNKQRVGR